MPVTPNRSYPYPPEYEGDWYNTFVTMLTAIDSDMASVISAGQQQIVDINILKNNPGVRLTGTEAGAADVRMVEISGNIYFQRNTGSYAAPAWVNMMAFTAAGDILMYTSGKGIGLVDINGLTRRLGLDVDGTTLVTDYP